MADYTITLAADPSQVLQAFQKISQSAGQTGGQVGKGLSDGIATAEANIDALKAQIKTLAATRASLKVDSTEFKTAQQQIDLLQGKLAQARGERLKLQVDSNSITAITNRLQADLNRLQQRQIAVNVDDGEFVTLGREIDRVQQELAALDRKRLIVAVDDKSVSALQLRLQELQQKQTRISVDSAQFRTLQTEAEKVQAELTAIERKRVLINVDSNSITAVTTRLQGELERLQQRQLKVNVDSKEFVTLGQQINQVQEELSQVERKKLLIGVDAGSVVALQSKLQDLQQKQIKLSIDSAGFRTLETEINKAQQELADFGRRKLLLNVDPNSITAATAKLQAELERLQQRQVRINVNSREFDALGLQIQQTEAELQALERRRLSIGVDSNSITSLQVRLGELTQQLNRVAIGGQRFRELQSEIEATKRQLDRAGESADGFRLLDGVVQGVAFSLSNGVVNAAGSAFRALQGAVMQYAALDTEIRKASSASGETGAYDKIAAAVDQVGIEAAGTTQEVAQLYTELARSGMTVDQANASLGAIVRGAEATGTSFDSMGRIVAATLKQFGLPASQATRVVDALTQGANASAASVEGLGYAFKYAGPVAKTLGLSVEDLGVAVGLLTNAGIDASEAGVTLRNGLSKLASAAPAAGSGMQDLHGQAAQAARAMKTLGVDIYNADGTLKPMRQTLLSLKAAFSTLGPAAKIRLASSMFGGEDDGTKWVALLDQSTEEINKMADAMDNTRGRTDQTRKEMQGFELLLKQVDGTIGSLVNVFGKITTAALMPFVNVANGVLSIISGLPGPVKDTAAAFILLSGGVAVATAAVVIYQRVMASAIGEKAIGEVVALAGAFRNTLGGAIRGLIANFPALIGQLTVMAARFTYVLAIVQAYQSITGAAAEASAGFEDRLKATQAALDSIGPSADKAGSASERLAGSGSGVIRFFENLPGVIRIAAAPLELLVRLWDIAVEGFSRASALNTVKDQTEQLQGAFTGVQKAAQKTFEALKGSTTLTGEQRKDIADRIAALKTVKEQADSQAKAYEDLAKNYRARGMSKEAEIAANNASAMRVEVDTTDRLISGLQGLATTTSGLNTATSEAISLTDQLTNATRQRIEAEQAAGGIDNRLAAGQALLGVTKAIGEAEQARFNVSKAGLELELRQAQARGAGEGELEAIRLRIAAADREALTARFRALVREQELQRSLLALEQQKARIQAEQELAGGRADRLQAELELSKATGNDEKARIQRQIEGIDAQIGLRERALALLNQTQPLERQAADLQAQTARAGLQAAAAQDGYRIAANGSLVAISAVAQQQQRAAELTQTMVSIERQLLQQRLSNADALASAMGSLSSLEASRFSVIQSALAFELQATQERYTKEEESARKRGASEQELAGIKARGDRDAASIRQRINDQERIALNAKYQQLQREQEIELAILALKQQQQQVEAQMAVRRADVDLRAAQSQLGSAMASGNQKAIADAQFLVEKQQILLAGEREKLGLLLQGQQIERAGVVLRQGAADNSIRAEQAAKGFAVAQEDSTSASRATLTVNQEIKNLLQQSATSAVALARVPLADALKGAAEPALVIGTQMVDASDAANNVKKLDLSGEMDLVATNTAGAAIWAREFYRWLKLAAALPGARWSGGPVEAGQEYRINELGQEAFLSAGRLSLIDAPANSIWRAPSPGVVIPAGVTARLQERGMAPVAVTGAAGNPGIAELAVEVGKLRAEVGNLARRDWSVHVQQRTGPTGAQVLRRLL